MKTKIKSFDTYQQGWEYLQKKSAIILDSMSKCDSCGSTVVALCGYNESYELLEIVKIKLCC